MDYASIILSIGMLSIVVTVQAHHLLYSHVVQMAISTISAPLYNSGPRVTGSTVKALSLMLAQ